MPTKKFKGKAAMAVFNNLAGKQAENPDRAIDWGQYRLNGGSYCMAVQPEDDRYCGRAERWPGHNHKAGWPNHPFVPGCPEPPHPTVGVVGQ